MPISNAALRKRRRTKTRKAADLRERFCYEYCIDYNATQAAIRAGYSKKTARSQGQRLLTKADIQQKIEELKADLVKATGITAMRIAKEHEKIAFSSIAHLHNTWIERKEFDKLTADQKACIQEISTKVATLPGTTISTEFIKIKLYDKQKSLDSLSHMFGFNAAIEIIDPRLPDLSGMNYEQLYELKHGRKPPSDE